MCNLYVMYYTDAEEGRSSFFCSGENIPELTAALPANSDTPLPPNRLLEEHAKHVHKEDMVPDRADWRGRSTPTEWGHLVYVWFVRDRSPGLVCMLCSANVNPSTYCR